MTLEDLSIALLNTIFQSCCQVLTFPRGTQSSETFYRTIVLGYASRCETFYYTCYKGPCFTVLSKTGILIP